MKIELTKATPTLIVILIGSALLFGLLARPAEMGVMVVACSIALAFVNIDRIQRFKGAGFEAEMRKVVEEAYATTESLKALARPLVLSMLENMISAGRWGGMNEEKKQALKEELDALSSSMGIRDGDISAALQKFYIWHGIDRIHHLDTLMGQKHISNEPARKALLALCDRTASELPAVESVRTALSGLKDEELEILEPYIEDYAYYCTHKKMRPTGVFTE